MAGKELEMEKELKAGFREENIRHEERKLDEQMRGKGKVCRRRQKKRAD